MRVTAFIAACLFFAAPAFADRTVQVYGVSSWYGFELAGRKMANGQPFRPMARTAACWFLPLGTKAKVTDAETGRSVIVTITDRGPGVHGRVIDLSLGAARALGFERAGLARVWVEATVQETEQEFAHR